MRQTVHLDILVPLADNEGRSFPLGLFEYFEALLLDVAGGFTRRGDVEGMWRSPDGHVFRDHSRAYALTLLENDTDNTVAAVDSFIRDQFHQEDTFLELVPTRAASF
ncbi:MAG TPA: hypothetical protein VJ276_23705 [Thermoanaerobaculia bacterium]|nr:hypothetical protein [Thermoanaerobaculia bacterium]